MKKNIKFKNYLIVVCIILFIFIVMSLISTLFQGVPTSPPMFENIGEFQSMVINIPDDATFDLYSDTSKDRYIKDLNYNSFFAGKYSSSTIKFEIFAYEFTDGNSAKQYISNFGLKEELEAIYHTSFGMFGRCKFIVVNKNKAYTVITKSNNYNAVNEFLCSNFSLVFNNGEYVFKQ